MIAHSDYEHMDHLPNRRYIVLNKNVEVEHISQHTIDFRKKFMAAYNSGAHFYEFFYDYRNGTFALTHFPDLETASIYDVTVQYTGTIPNKIFDPQILVTEQFLWVLDRNPGSQRMIRYDLEFREYKVFDLSPKLKRGKIYDWQLDTLSTANRMVCTRQERAGKQAVSYVTTWDDLGALDLEYDWPADQFGNRPQSIRILESEEGEHMVYGSYGRIGEDKSLGVYVKEVQDGSVMETRRTPFYTMKHFFDYLSPQEKEDHNRRMRRLERHEKDLNVSAWVNVYPAFKQSNKGILITFDVFNYINTADNQLFLNGRAVVGMPDQVGMRYSHAMVLRFDEHGQFKQDNYMPLTDQGLNAYDKKCLTQLFESDTLRLVCSNSHMTYLAELKPNTFLRHWTDTSLYVEDPTIVDRRQEVRFAFGDAILVYGIKTRVEKDNARRKLHIYFIEKRKLR